MHHAWLFAGKQGLGKHAFARKAAREYIGNSGANGGYHPDLLILERQPKDDKEAAKRDEGKPFERKRNITVGQVRTMQRRLETRPTAGSRRAIIIDPADVMEPGASNALLKSLEEPPRGTCFILIAHHSARLLPTIRSRCRVLRFPALARAQIMKLIEREHPGVSLDVRLAAATVANGAPGRAFEFIERDLGPVHAVLDEIASSGDPAFSLRSQLANMVGPRPSRDALADLLDLAQSILTHAASSADVQDLPNFANAHDDLVRLAGQLPIYNFDAGSVVAETGTLLAGVRGYTGNRNG